MPRSRLYPIAAHLLRPSSVSCRNPLPSAASRSFHPDFPDPSPSPDPVSELAAFFSKPPPLRTWFDSLRCTEALTPNVVQLVLKRVHGWKAALEFFNWATSQPNFRHTCYTYSTLAEILAGAKKTQFLRALVNEMVSSRISTTPGALGFFIRCLRVAGLYKEASFLFDHAKLMNCVPDVYAYNCLLEALSRSGRVDLVEFRYKEMIDLGWEPDKYTLTALLQAYCSSSRIEEALSVFDRIKEGNWVDEHVFAILVVSLSKCGEVDKALEFVNSMEDYNVKLNEKTVCVLIHGLKQEKKVKDALVLFSRMDGLGFRKDLALYSVLIDGLCESGEFAKALDLYVEMTGSGISPDAGVIAKLVKCLCGIGDFDNVNGLILENMRVLEVDTGVLVYNAILEELVSKGEVDQAYLLLQAMMKSTKFESHKSEVESDETVPEYLKIRVIRFGRGVKPNPSSYNIVIDGLCQNDKLDMALELLSDMIKMGCTGNILTYNNLIHELCNVNRIDESYEVLTKMNKCGFKPTSFTYNSIFGCLCRRENVAEALDLIKEMKCNGHEPWVKHYTLLVKQLCVHGKVLEACSFLIDLTMLGFLPSVIAYSAAIDGLCNTGKLDQAISLFQDLSAYHCLPDVVAHNIIIRGLCKAGRVLEAQDMVNEMLSKGLIPSVITYNLLINGWCKIDKVDEALLLFSKMIDEGWSPTVVTYTTLIDGFCNSKRPDEAISIWNMMLEKRCAPNKIAYMALINGLCKCDHPNDALCYFREMEDVGLESDTFIYVILVDAFISKENPLMTLEILNKIVKKEKCPGPTDKYYSLWVYALLKLHKDERTSFSIKKLIEDGCIPTIHSVDDLGKVAESYCQD